MFVSFFFTLRLMGLISACEFLIADNGCPADYIYEALSSSAIESI